MRLVVQRVKEACVSVEGEEISRIGQGLMVLVGVKVSDTAEDAAYCAQKIAQMRIFEDGEGKMNRSVADIGGEVLLVSQFTLLGDVRKGRRPSFIEAARPQEADALYRQVAGAIEALDIPVKLGVFGADMQVSLINDGPVTILLDSERSF